MRFDDEGYLQNWSAGLGWPAIHAELFDLIVGDARGDTVLDLGCSTGLLALRLYHAGFNVVGVEQDPKAIELAERYGVLDTISIRRLSVDPAHPAALMDVVREEGVNTLVARRCFPEIFGEHVDLGYGFALALRQAGVSEVYIQGRASSARSQHPLNSVEREVALFDRVFKPVTVRGQIAVLRA